MTAIDHKQKPTFAAVDRIEIHELVTSYGFHHDRRDFEALGSCFTPDATYTLKIADGESFGPHSGRDAIIAQIRKFKESQSDVRRHHISNVQVTPITENEASVTSYVLVTATSSTEGLKIITVGNYSDLVRRTPEGWKIAGKELLLDTAF